MEAEFFGYRKGAFTGATMDRDGFFQAANGGTLMLDEVADLPLAMQVKLLRAIQERRVRKLGATLEEAVDVRIISASHQNLASCVEAGKFRQDLFYRLNVIELSLPALRERLDDLEALIEAILRRLNSTGSKVLLGAGVLQTLRSYAFPGNVRELENILERALAFADDGVIEVENLALKGGGAASLPERAQADAAPAHTVDLPRCLPDYLDQVERDIISRALAQTRFNRTQAAQLLGISLRQLRYQMHRLAIPGRLHEGSDCQAQHFAKIVNVPTRF
jgi:two-component system response regulator PilR (NtrC family)